MDEFIFKIRISMNMEIAFDSKTTLFYMEVFVVDFAHLQPLSGMVNEVF